MGFVTCELIDDALLNDDAQKVIIVIFFTFLEHIILTPFSNCICTIL